MTLKTAVKLIKNNNILITISYLFHVDFFNSSPNKIEIVAFSSDYLR